VNAEHEPSPERRAFYTPPGAHATEVVRAALAEVHDIEIEFRLVSAFDAHGAGFAAFLLLPDTKLRAASIVQDYEAVYADAWNSLDDLATDTIEALGWRDELSEFTTKAGIPENYLTWNLQEAHGHLRDMYNFVALDGLIHAFHR
jgi:hypothetical protein